MNRIDRVFVNRGVGTVGRAFVAYLTAGDPDMDTSLQLMLAVSDCGADILEIGIPFSDPIADGPVIQSAFQRALRNGTNVAKVLELVSRLRERSDIAIVLFTYYNPVLQFGLERFAKKAADVGADGVLILDLPVESCLKERNIFFNYGLHWVTLIAPTTPYERAKKLADMSSGFIYYVSREGVTGEQQSLAHDLVSKVRSMKSIFHLPICVGFGISNKSHVRAISTIADGVVVGSALVRRVESAITSGTNPVLVMKDFLIPLVEEAHSAEKVAAA